MESVSMTTQTRKTTQFIIPKPNVTKLKILATKLPDGSRSDIKKRYGNLLELLEVNVQTEAISAMAQYYDSPLRCFTFSNFQLAPTLEEFSLILGQPLNDGKPYHFYGGYPRVKTVAKALRVDPDDINNKKLGEETPERIPRARVEEVMDKLLARGDWATLAEVLVLAIYDLVLFPSSGDFVGRGAVDVFMARKCRRENSTFPILADMYYTLSLCHEGKGKRILCCAPILFIWLTAHVIPRKFSTACPISEWKKLSAQIFGANEWKQKFMELTEDTVRWYPLAGGVKQVILNCGDFPNVPLVGTFGCINYNPHLALRQLRYPMMDPPTSESTLHFRTELANKAMLERISKAWQNVTYKGGKELGNKSCGARATYKEWVRSRVEAIKLPFPSPMPKLQQETDTVMQESDEVKIMTDKLARSEKEKEAIESELKEARSILKALEMECNEKARSLEQANKRARIEKDSGNKTKNYLSSTNQDLRKQIAECHGALKENEQLRRILQEREQQVSTLLAQQEADKQAYLEAIKGYQGHLEEKHAEVDELLKVREDVLEENWRLKGEVVDLEASQAAAIAQYERKIRDIQVEVNGMVHRYRTIIERKDEELRNLDHWAGERNHYMGLVRAAELNRIESWYEVGHWVHKLKNVRRIPELVRDAEAMVNPLTTPREAIELIDVCKGLTEEFEELVKQAVKDGAVKIIDV